MNCSLGVQSLFGSHWEASEVWRTLSFILGSYTILKTMNLFVHTCGDRYLFSLVSKELLYCIGFYYTIEEESSPLGPCTTIDVCERDSIFKA